MTLMLAPDRLSHLDTIGLPELIELAALQTRVDRKYLLPVGRLQNLWDALPSNTRVLEIDRSRSFGYESIYFDTLDLDSYYLAAHRRRRRFKVRTRTYLDSGEQFLEVKTRGARGSTVKDRMPLGPGQMNTLLSQAFIAEVLCRDGLGAFSFAPLTQTLITQYRRLTLFLPGSNSRVTVDTELVWIDQSGRRIALSDLAIVETKSGSTPSSVDRLLWSQHCRPARISKYATGLAALRPHLPSHRWRRTLNQHFAIAS